MKLPLLLSVLMVYFLMSCSDSKYIVQDKCDCSNYLNFQDSIDTTVKLCVNDTCRDYFEIWKSIFLTKNQMQEDYFDNHIFPISTKIHSWDDGISFEISYKAKYDWVESKLYDNLTIWLSPSTVGLYPRIDIPRNVLLTSDQIMELLDNKAFSSHLQKVAVINGLKFNSRENAFKSLIKASNVDTLCTSSIYYLDTNGHPFLEGSGTLSWEENQCIFSKVDLVTGDVKIDYGVCWIN